MHEFSLKAGGATAVVMGVLAIPLGSFWAPVYWSNQRASADRAVAGCQ